MQPNDGAMSPIVSFAFTEDGMRMNLPPCDPVYSYYTCGGACLSRGNSALPCRKNKKPGTIRYRDQSARRDSNPRPSPWQGDTPPLSHSRLTNKTYITACIRICQMFVCIKFVFFRYAESCRIIRIKNKCSMNRTFVWSLSGCEKKLQKLLNLCLLFRRLCLKIVVTGGKVVDSGRMWRFSDR